MNLANMQSNMELFCLKQISSHENRMPIIICLHSDLLIIGKRTLPSLKRFHHLSRRHAILRKRNTDWFIEDLKSKHGTYVNFKLITETCQLENGDIIGFGYKSFFDFGLICTFCLVDNKLKNYSSCNPDVGKSSQYYETEKYLNKKKQIVKPYATNKECFVKLVRCDSKYFKLPHDVRCVSKPYKRSHSNSSSRKPTKRIREVSPEISVSKVSDVQNIKNTYVSPKIVQSKNVNTKTSDNYSNLFLESSDIVTSVARPLYGSQNDNEQNDENYDGYSQDEEILCIADDDSHLSFHSSEPITKCNTGYESDFALFDDLPEENDVQLVYDSMSYVESAEKIKEFIHTKDNVQIKIENDESLNDQNNSFSFNESIQNDSFNVHDFEKNVEKDINSDNESDDSNISEYSIVLNSTNIDKKKPTDILSEKQLVPSDAIDNSGHEPSLSGNESDGSDVSIHSIIMFPTSWKNSLGKKKIQKRSLKDLKIKPKHITRTILTEPKPLLPRSRNLRSRKKTLDSAQDKEPDTKHPSSKEEKEMHMNSHSSGETVRDKAAERKSLNLKRKEKLKAIEISKAEKQKETNTGLVTNPTPTEHGNDHLKSRVNDRVAMNCGKAINKTSLDLSKEENLRTVEVDKLKQKDIHFDSKLIPTKEHLSSYENSSLSSKIFHRKSTDETSLDPSQEASLKTKEIDRALKQNESNADLVTKLAPTAKKRLEHFNSRSQLLIDSLVEDASQNYRSRKKRPSNNKHINNSSAQYQGASNSTTESIRKVVSNTNKNRSIEKCDPRFASSSKTNEDHMPDQFKSKDNETKQCLDNTVFSYHKSITSINEKNKLIDNNQFSNLCSIPQEIESIKFSTNIYPRLNNNRVSRNEPQLKSASFREANQTSYKKPTAVVAGTIYSRSSNAGVHELIEKIVGLKVQWIDQQRNLRLPPFEVYQIGDELPLSFETYESYVSAFQPLLMLEIWDIICKYAQPILDSGFNSQKFYFTISGIKQKGSLVTYDCQSLINEKSPPPTEGNLVILSITTPCVKVVQAHTILGYITKHQVKNNYKMAQLSPQWNRCSEWTTGAKLYNFSVVAKLGDFKPDCTSIMKGNIIVYVKKNFHLAAALNKFKNSPLCGAILEPNERAFGVNCYPTSHHSELKFNASQKSMIESVGGEIEKDDPEAKVFLLHGPPGTGKTHAIVGLLEYLIFSNSYSRDNKILITAPSTAALDEIGLRIMELNERLSYKQAQIKFIRIGKDEGMNAKMQEYSLDNKTNSTIRAPDKLNIVQSNEFYNKKIQILKESHVVLATLKNCWHPTICSKQFAACIVDEATQCTEMEILQPLSLNIHKLLLVGDFYQLPAKVYSELAIQKCFNRSMFERLYLHLFSIMTPNPTFMLREQFRMHPEICAFPSKFFYEDKIKTEFDNYDEFPICPYYVFSVFDANQGSEIAKIVKMCGRILAAESSSTIGVIVPHQDQIEPYKRTISHLISCNENIEVNIVDNFQGKEKDIIVISYLCPKYLAESENSLSCKGRFNVAITRARRSLLVCVNSNILKNYEHWNALMHNARDRNRLLFVKKCKTILKKLPSCIIPGCHKKSSRGYMRNQHL